MIYEEISSESRTRRTLTGAARVLSALRMDGPLVTGLALAAAYGLVVLYSASAENLPMALRTAMRLVLGTAAVLALARVSPNFLRRTSPWLYAIGVILLLAVPMMCAWYLHERPLPHRAPNLLLLVLIIIVP